MRNGNDRRWVALTSIVVGSVLILAAQTAAAQWLPRLGACCVDMSCHDGWTKAQCDAVCGTWNAGRTCAQTICPACIAGVCCIDGKCYDDFAGCDSCRCAGGTWMPMPIGHGCDPNPCEPPRGACCVDYTCKDDLTQAECDAICGTWNPGQACSNIFCPICIWGVCCIDGHCYDDFAGCDSCRCAGGTWMPMPIGHGCDPNPCEPPRGACCVDYTCKDDLTQAECDAICGTWNPGQTCHETICAVCIWGVCCIDGHCYDDFAGCDSCRCAGGTWMPMPIGHGCDPNPCRTLDTWW